MLRFDKAHQPRGVLCIGSSQFGESQPTEHKPAAKQILEILSPFFQGTDFQRSAIELAKRTLEAS